MRASLSACLGLCSLSFAVAASGCITPVVQTKGRAKVEERGLLDGQTIGVLPPETALGFTTPETRGVRKAVRAAAIVVSGPASAGATTPEALPSKVPGSSTDWTKLEEKVADPGVALTRHARTVVSRHFDAKIVDARPFDFKGTESAAPSRSDKRFSLEVGVRSYGLRPAPHKKDLRLAFLDADVQLYDWAGLTRTVIFGARCDLTGDRELEMDALQRTSGGFVVDEEIRHLVRRCLKTFEIDLCRFDQPHDDLGACLQGGYGSDDD